MAGEQKARGGKRSAAKGGAETPEPGKTSLGIGVVPLSGGGIFKSAAVAVLKQERKLMTTGDITRVALERGLINCQGKTPEATMASALYTDVKRKHNKSVFTRPQEGLFGLREWIAEGFYPEGWSGPADSEGVAPYKRRGSGASGSRGRSGLGRASKRRAAAAWKRAGSDTGDSEDEAGEGEEGHEVDEGQDDGLPQESSQMDVDEPPYSSGGRRRRAAAADNGYVNGSGSRRESRDGTGRTGGSTGGTYLQGIPNLGNLPQDDLDLESPLHVLGDVALSTRDQEELEEAQAPSSTQRGGRVTKRERERPAALQLPDNPMAHSAPKSPYEDSLAALHEIATGGSPHGFTREASTEGRKRPRLQVDVDQGQAHMQAMQHSAGDFFPGMHLASPLLTTARGRRGGPQQFIHPLPSPVGTMEGGHLGIPELLPGVPGDQQGLLFSPTLMQHIHNGNTPRIGGTSADGTADGNKNPFKPDGPYGYGLPQHLAPYHAGMHSFGPHPTQLTPEERFTDAEGLQQVVQRLEARLGPTNPITAKAWLALARMFHSLSKPLGAPAASKAMAALQRAAQLASEAATALGCPWLGNNHVHTLVKSLNAAGAPSAAGQHVLGSTPNHVSKASTSVLASGAGATTLSLGPSTLIPPSSAATLSSAAAATTSLITPLCLGTPPVQGPTMQVIPAGHFNPEQVPINMAVLNLCNRDDEQPKPASGAGITKLILQPAAPATLQLGTQSTPLQLGATPSLALATTSQPLQLDLPNPAAAQSSPGQQQQASSSLQPQSTPLKSGPPVLLQGLTPQAVASPVPLQLTTAPPGGGVAGTLQLTPALMPRLQLGLSEPVQASEHQGQAGEGEKGGSQSQHTVDLMQPAAPVLAHA